MMPMPSFSYQVKEELCRRPLRERHCMQAELAGITHVSGALFLSGSGTGISYTTEHPSIVTRLFSLYAGLFSLTPLLSQTKNQLQKEVYQIRVIFSDLENALQTLAVTLTPMFGVNQALLASLLGKDCCKAAYLRGAFLGSGSMTDPEKEYHLEIVSGSSAVAEVLRNLMSSVEISAGITARKENTVVYLKDSTGITTLLTHMGAHTAVLEIENIRIYKNIRGNINRQYNWESANIDRTVRSAMTQLKNITLIEEYQGLSSLTPALQEAATLRLQHPEASLEELASLSKNKSSKSAMNNRLRKLAGIAEAIKKAYDLS
ncbi:MAG: DNA-binding protein WhiA [Christensenellaceae bacterium]|jgi:DNA-binding protein WhiA